jgi:hypothetical protein
MPFFMDDLLYIIIQDMGMLSIDSYDKKGVKTVNNFHLNNAYGYFSIDLMLFSY